MEALFKAINFISTTVILFIVHQYMYVVMNSLNYTYNYTHDHRTLVFIIFTCIVTILHNSDIGLYYYYKLATILRKNILHLMI